MQFHSISPIMLIPFALDKTLIGVIISTGLLVGNIIITSLIINHYPGTELGAFFIQYLHLFVIFLIILFFI